MFSKLVSVRQGGQVDSFDYGNDKSSPRRISVLASQEEVGGEFFNFFYLFFSF